MSELPMVKETCETCRFWEHDKVHNPGQGDCHRGLRFIAIDVINNLPASSAEDWVWPEHANGDWCGEWKAKPPVKVDSEAWEDFTSYRNMPVRVRKVLLRQGITSFDKLASVRNPMDLSGFGMSCLHVLVKAMKARSIAIPASWPSI